MSLADLNSSHNDLKWKLLSITTRLDFGMMWPDAELQSSTNFSKSYQKPDRGVQKFQLGATFVRKLFVKNFVKSPNLVTLV